MRRIWTATAAAAALATAFAIPPAFAQETQQGKEAPGNAGSLQRPATGQMGGKASQSRAQAQTEHSPMGAGEREQPGKPGMKGKTAQQQPENMQPGNTPQRQTGSQAGERREEPQGERGAQNQERKGQAENGNRPGQPGSAAEQNRTGQAQSDQAPNRQTQAGGQAAGHNVQATGKTNIPQDKAAQVAQTLRGAGVAQTSPNINVNEVRIGADMPGDVVINPLPPAILQIVPEFRGYDYFVVGDEVVIVDPASRQVVEIIEDVG